MQKLLLSVLPWVRLFVALSTLCTAFHDGLWFCSVDVDHDGFINFEEFCFSCYDSVWPKLFVSAFSFITLSVFVPFGLRRTMTVSLLGKVFSRFSVTFAGHFFVGYICLGELIAVFQEVGRRKEEAEKVFANMDRNHDGKISFEEFQVGNFVAPSTTAFPSVRFSSFCVVRCTWYEWRWQAFKGRAGGSI